MVFYTGREDVGMGLGGGQPRGFPGPLLFELEVVNS